MFNRLVQFEFMPVIIDALLPTYVISNIMGKLSQPISGISKYTETKITAEMVHGVCVYMRNVCGHSQEVATKY